MPGVSFHRLAERELNDTACYYDHESPGLGQTFLDAVEKHCSSILENPRSGTSVAGNVRRRLVHRFPYALLYSERAGGVRILAVMNLKRRPMYWVAESEDRPTEVDHAAGSSPLTRLGLLLIGLAVLLFHQRREELR